MENKDAENEPLANSESQKKSGDDVLGGGLDKEEEGEEEEKSETGLSILEGLDQTRAPVQPIYQIRPPLSEKFKPMSAKEVIHEVLFDQLSTKVYNEKEARLWCQEIADIIRVKVKDLKFKRYKYIVNVVLGEHRGAGVKMGTRCIWDAEADSYAHDNFFNESIFCVATIYAVYHY